MNSETTRKTDARHATRTGGIIEVHTDVVAAQAEAWDIEELRWSARMAYEDEEFEYDGPNPWGPDEDLYPETGLSALFYGDDNYTGLSISELIHRSSFDGHSVLYADFPDLDELRDPTEVPHFGHSISCWPKDEDGNRLRDEEPTCSSDGGVLRVFGTSLVLDGEFGGDSFGTYELSPGVRISINGFRYPSNGDVERKKLGE